MVLITYIDSNGDLRRCVCFDLEKWGSWLARKVHDAGSVSLCSVSELDYSMGRAIEEQKRKDAAKRGANKKVR